MKKIIYLLLLLPCFILQGCDDFLGNKPKEYTIPERFEDYVKLLAAPSVSKCLTGEVNFLTDDIHLFDKTVQASTYAYMNKAEEEKNLYSFQKGQIYVPGNHDVLWNTAYDRIYTLNTVINDVLGSKDGSSNEKQRLRAEALYHRAFEYFTLVNIYGAHYDKNTAATDYGVPIVKAGSIVENYKRNTVAEVYKFIEDDLKEAFPSLKQIPLNLFHPGQNSVYSFYARMYLYMGRFDEALTNANKALEAKNTLLDLKPYTTKTNTTWKRIILPDGTPILDKHESPEAVYVRLSDDNVFAKTGVSRELTDLFKKDLPTGSLDQRRELYYLSDSADLGRVDYFPGETTYTPWMDVNHGFSTVENYLIAAECEARIGSKDVAMEHINHIRDYRIINNTPLTAATKDEALIKVLEERRRELAFVGMHRLADLKRLNKEERFKKTVIHTADGETFTLPAGNNRYIFPICQMILDYNPGMPQYER